MIDAGAPAAEALPGGVLDAFILDMDGVLTDTASLHRAAWRHMFDDFLGSRGGGQAPFSAEDYRKYVDGKPRLDGVESFLASRGIEIPRGSPDDPADRETVHGLGRRKNERFHQLLREEGARPYPTSVEFVEQARRRGFALAVVSSSRNCATVLERAGLAEHFDARVDGNELARLNLPGKPDPAMFLEAAKRLGSRPDRAAAVEDALAGVEAGRRGGFRVVIGVDRDGRPEDLYEHGADIVVNDLGALEIPEPIRRAPSGGDG